MPSTDASKAPSPVTLPPPPAQAQAWPAVQLAQANRALWVATLSLMTAFMQTPAPAHRYLLARRIGRNFDTLSRADCFDTGCRASFVRLARRWAQRAEHLAP
jgi:hypothetical protein